MKVFLPLELSEERTPEQIEQLRAIMQAMADVGAAWGVKGGKTIINFDAEGIFRAIGYDYLVWVKRK